MQVEDALNNIKPQPAALLVVAAGFIHLVEPLEDAVPFLFGNPDAAVEDLDLDAVVFGDRGGKGGL